MDHSPITSSIFDNQADVMLAAKPAEPIAAFQRLTPAAAAVSVVRPDMIAILQVVVRREKPAVVSPADVRMILK